MTGIIREDDGDGPASIRPLKNGDAATPQAVITDDEIHVIDDGLAEGASGRDEADEPSERRLRTADIRAEEAAEAADEREGLTPEERQQRATERRERRKQSKQRRRAREASSDLLIKSLQTQLSEMKTQLHSVAERSDGQDLVQIRTAMDETKRYLANAEATIRDAFAKQDGEAHTYALKAYTQAEKRLESLQRIERNLVESPPSAALKSSIAAPMQAHMRAWMGQNSWFDATGRDEDSGIALVVDARVKADGFDPNTGEYWEELDRRLARRLPARYRDQASEDDDNEETPRRGGPPVGGGGRDRKASVAAGKREYTITKTRMEELKRTGVWDDPEARTKYLNAYKKWDKANPTSRAPR